MSLYEDDGARQPDPIRAKWIKEIRAYEKLSKRWELRSLKIIKRYKNDRTESSMTLDGARLYNVLWSNIETLKPLLYSATPKPEVTRRFLDSDSVGNEVAQILERAISYTLAEHYFGSCMRQSVLDYLLPGRGTVWARYVPHFAPTGGGEGAPTPAEPDNSEQLTDDAGSETTGEMVAFEEAVPDFVHWQDFGHTYGRTWEEVTGVWRKVRLTRKQLVEHFPECGAAIPLDGDKDMSDDTAQREDTDKVDQRATVYEIWDKPTLSVLFVNKSYPAMLKTVGDPLQLPQFFPCPRPLYATLANDGLIPVPDYIEYQDQALELDDLTARIAGITRAIRVTGVYDASVKALERIMTEGTDNRLVPVENWAGLSEKGGLKGAMELVPMQEIAQTLLALYEARDKVKGDLYEITGMSDIVRGNTDPRETATAQKGKIRFATMRLDERQREVARFARNVVVIIGNIIARKFGQDTLAKMTGVKLFQSPEEKQQAQQIADAMQQPPQPGQPPMQPPPLPQGWSEDDAKHALDKPTWAEVMALMRDDPDRNFRIDIQTDSTVANDQESDKQEANEFLGAMGNFLGEAAKAPPAMVPLISELLKFAVRRYPIGRQLESTLDEMLDDLAKQSEAPPQPPPPDPAIAVKQQEVAQNGERDKAAHGLNERKAADDHAYRMATLKTGHERAMAELAIKREELGLKRDDSDTKAADVEAKHALKAVEIATDDRHREADREHEREEAEASRQHGSEEAEAGREHASEEGEANRKAAADKPKAAK